MSIKKPKVYSPPATRAVQHPSGRPLRVVVVDVGLKYNQLRCFLKRGVEVEVVPWDYDFPSLSKFDGLFISNGPGDPAMLEPTVRNIRKVLTDQKTPVFGICLGHQLLARAAGCSTSKMKFGNRGHNIPCTDRLSGKCYITSQNHGFQVDAKSLPDGWEELFVNANDDSNEGIRHISRPYFSVQFHPESNPGPRDTEFLFQVFIDTVLDATRSKDTLSRPVAFPGGTLADNEALHPPIHVKKVLVLGSGGLSIGQAGEFDYSGSQAIKALKEEGIYTILINPNIATIQTSKGLADKVYFLPVTADSVRKIIKRERPDAVYVTFGGQTALQVGIAMKDEFEALGVRVLGTPIDTIITTEDRELFARKMDSIGEKCAKSASANNVAQAMEVVKDIGFPVIVRAAYALGGLGSGFASDEAELLDLCNKAFAASPQVLIERSMKGWKEIEYEVVRDAFDNCITVCNMENFDPLGIHTGDSIVVAPSQTLSDEDYNMLRTTAVNVIRSLGVVGECNIQYALNPESRDYCIIEVNARLSRSSALASKATGYPLAFVAAKLGLNMPLNKIKNTVTQKTCACFEPSLDYVVVKIPRWDLRKFTRVSSLLSSSMKSVGEVMSIGRTFEEAIQKGIRAVDYQNLGFNETNALMSIDSELQTPSDQRLFAIANAMHAGYSVDKIWEMTRIDKWFLRKLDGLIKFGTVLKTHTTTTASPALFRRAKELGFSDRQLAQFWGTNELDVHWRRIDAGIKPFVKQIDTVAAEFPAFTNYLYLTYNATEHDITFRDKGVMVLGSGVYRIGSSVEFDWCSVRAIRTLRENGLKTVMVNYNPETVSTDYDEADRLYFENITLETVQDIFSLEESSGVIVSVGGQTPNNIAFDLHRQNVNVYGTSPLMIHGAENRFSFSRTLDSILVDQPEWKNLTSIEEAMQFCKDKYPVLVRPSYVLSGAAMNTVYSEKDLSGYLQQASDVSRDYPVVITKYIEGAKEIEMDAVAKEGKLLCHFISEHVENAGVHSGDATLILPPQDLEPETVRRIEVATERIADAFNVTGPLNIQFIAKNNEIKVIECNIRASRSFPFVSKVMGVDLIEIATKAMLNIPVQKHTPVAMSADYVGVKVPQFSFSRLSGADPVLGVEMASTGEVACFGRDKYEAYIKALVSTGFRLPKKNILFSIGSFEHKAEMLPSIQKLHELGFKLFATPGTADFLQEHGVPVKYLEVLGRDDQEQASEYSLTQHLANNLIDLYINLPSSNRFRRPANYMSKGYRTRRMAVDYQTPLVTNVKNAKLLIEAIARNFDWEISKVDYQTSHRTVTLPGLVNVAAFVPGLTTPGSTDLEAVTRASIMGGFSMIRVMPVDLGKSLVDSAGLRLAQQNSRKAGGPKCDFNFSVTATASNAGELHTVADEVGSLFIPFNHTSGNIDKIAAVTAHFSSWPSYKPIVTDAKTSDLGLILLYANLHNRKIHVTSVTTKEDITLISLSKEKGFPVTCDVSIYALFLTRHDHPTCSTLPTEKDQAALWANMDAIDILSIGVLPYQIATTMSEKVPADVGIQEALPLLFSAVADGRLTVDDVIVKLHDNPIKIFDIHDQDGSTVEIEFDRAIDERELTPSLLLKGVPRRAAVQRVTFKNQVAVLENDFQQSAPNGRDMSSHLPPELQTAQLSQYKVKSPKIQAQREVTSLRKQSLIDSNARFPPRTSVSHSPDPYSRIPSSPIIERPTTMRGHRGSTSIPSTQEPAVAKDDYESAPLITAPRILSTSALDHLSSSPFRGRHIITVNEFSKQDLHLLFAVASDMRIAVQRQGTLSILSSRVICTAFFEPSTRTSVSFDAAMQRLGGRVCPMPQINSSSKGESLQDTIRTLASYGDAIVLRHPDNNSADIAAKHSPVPIFNAGNGTREHPTQAFLDLFTIREELGTANGLNITFVGDLKYGRTVHSLCQLLAHYPTTSIQLVAPDSLSLPAHIRQNLLASGQLTAESSTLDPAILANSDVIYCTRVQKERFPSVEAYESVKDSFRVDSAVLRHCKKSAIVMHPLPRNLEVHEEVDGDSRAAYFRQMRYGLFCRMALLALVLAP